MGSPDTLPTEGMRTVVRASNGVAATVSACRVAQLRWQRSRLKTRLTIITEFRKLIVRELEVLSRVCGPLDASEALAAEILPLLEACEFLQSNAGSILKPRRLRRGGRPIWLSGVSAEVRREPLGVVLIVGPSNYPLMLPGIQAIQATCGRERSVVEAGCGVHWRRTTRETFAGRSRPERQPPGDPSGSR